MADALGCWGSAQECTDVYLPPCTCQRLDAIPLRVEGPGEPANNEYESGHRVELKVSPFGCVSR